MKVVLDTNVFISSFLGNGPPRRIIELWRSGRITLCLCAEILAEYADVLARLGLEGREELKEILDFFKLRSNIDFVVIAGDLRVVEADPGDDKFIECAQVAGAASIVSGDRHLKAIGVYEGIKVMAPTEFMAMFPAPGANRDEKN